jgi:alanine dehydrogenase
VGTNSAKVALGMGAQVTILDVKIDRLRYLADIFGNSLGTEAANPHTIAQAVREADLVIGAVLIPGARAPKLVTEEMVRTMRPGSVLVDVAIDQGGCIATMDHVTSHRDPVFVKHGVIHYAVGNMPGAVPRTSTFALTNVTIPYALQLADKGWQVACRENPALAKGVNIARGACTYAAVAQAQNLAYTPVDSLFSATTLK